MTKREQKLIGKVMGVLVQSRYGDIFVSYPEKKQDKILNKIIKEAVDIVTDDIHKQTLINNTLKSIKRR